MFLSVEGKIRAREVAIRGVLQLVEEAIEQGSGSQEKRIMHHLLIFIFTVEARKGDVVVVVCFWNGM